MNTDSVGIVIPSYNEGESLGQLIQEICLILPKSYIVVVDDSPTLSTVEIVRRLNMDQVEIIHREEKGGRGSAVLKGIEYLLTKPCSKIIEMDADFSHAPNELKDLLKLSEETHAGLLIASRYLPQSEIIHWPLARRLFSKASNFLAHLLLQVPIHDYTNGYRCYSIPAAQLITVTCGFRGKGFISLSEILVTLYYSGFSVKETPTRFVNRVRGESSVDFKEIKNALFGLFEIYQLKRTLLKEPSNGQLEKSRH